MSRDSLNCRMYEKRFPDVDELVMVQVKSIAEMGAYVTLLEYNNIEGMILLSELSRRRIRSIRKLISVGKQEVVVVLRVDKEKGYIDLSKRRVSPDEISKCEERYNKSKAVHSIMRHVAETQNRNLEELYVQIAWPIYRKYQGHAYDAFKLAIQDPEPLFQGIEIEPEIKDALVKNIRRRLTPQPVKIRSDIEVTCYQYEGIDAIKAALRVGEAFGTPETPISIKLVAPPLYVMVGVYIDKELGIASLQRAIDAITAEIRRRGGELVVKLSPRSVSEREEEELNEQLKDLELKNQDVAGDDDVSDADEGMGPAEGFNSDSDSSEEDDEEEEKPKPKGKGKSKNQ